MTGEEARKVRQALGLAISMVHCGDTVGPMAQETFDEALGILRKEEKENGSQVDSDNRATA